MEKYVSSATAAINAHDSVEEQQRRDFRTWHDASGFHWQHAALVQYKEGVVRLSSDDGTLLEIAEDQLAQDDIAYLHNQDLYKKAGRKVTFYPCCSSPNMLT